MGALGRKFTIVFLKRCQKSEEIYLYPTFIAKTRSKLGRKEGREGGWSEEREGKRTDELEKIKTRKKK